MLSELNRERVARATVTLPAKGGRGAVVAGGYVITAAHCIDCMCDGSMRAGANSQLVNIVTAVGTLRVMVLAVEPVCDLAVLGSLGYQEFPEEFEAFEDFCEKISPLIVSQEEFDRDRKISVHICISKNNWIAGKAKQTSGNAPWTYIETEEQLKGGSSGSPIVDESARLVGVVSFGIESPVESPFPASFPRPHLGLPAWLFREMAKG